MIIIKNPTQIDGIRKSSKLAALVLQETGKLVKPGISTESLNRFAHDFIINHGAIPAPLNYKGYPKSICTSINDVVCHGIPCEDRILQEGDIINIDITTILEGYYGDTSAMFTVGKIGQEEEKLIKVTKKALNMAINALAPEKLLNDCVGKVIEPYVKQFGFSVVKQVGGHGVGLDFHEDPFVFHNDRPDRVVKLKPGMIFTIEPMINMSKEWEVYVDAKDKWTIRTCDCSPSAQFEHTVLITNDSAEVLTAL